ncbi:MAG: histidine kinase [Desulfuromonas sp.]|nr:MAG: histidine kinase [Desulfuromonas sp.]
MRASFLPFAPAERASDEDVLRNAQLLKTEGIFEHFSCVTPFILMILNEQRQIVYSNQRLMEMIAVGSDVEVLGQRPGEVFDCIHAYEADAGCGTTEFCCECGAAKAILKAQTGEVGIQKECRLITRSGEAFELRVWASSYAFKGRNYTVFSLTDIRHEKRRQILERLFFHDVNNMLMPIVGFSEFLETLSLPDDVAECVTAMRDASRELASEIASHSKLLQAEDGRLTLELVDGISSVTLVDELVRMAKKIWGDTRITRAERCDEFLLTTDRAILYRVLFNMVKNAAEASSRGEVVVVSCLSTGSDGIFSVHNPNFIPRATRLQIFQRSFSTKGKGRGIGTYSMKLFAEQYLKGRVWFKTSENEGTTFYVSLPLLFCEEARELSVSQLG